MLTNLKKNKNWKYFHIEFENQLVLYFLYLYLIFFLNSDLLFTVDFINLLHATFETGSTVEIGIVGSMLWSLISNNQKGKLIARSSGFAQSIQKVLGKLTLITVPEEKKEKELIKMLQYVLQILSPYENKGEPS